MKKLLAAIFFTVSLSASAAPVYLNPICNYFGGSSGECSVYNSSGKDVNCTIQVTGNTRSGAFINAYESRYLYQNMTASVRVYATNPQDPITNLRATAMCNTPY